MHWDQSQTSVKFQKSLNILYWEMDDFFFSIKIQWDFPKILIFASPTFQNISSLYVLTLTYPSRRRNFPEHPKMDVRMVALTPPPGLRTYYAVGKTRIVSDWQFDKTG